MWRFESPPFNPVFIRAHLLFPLPVSSVQYRRLSILLVSTGTRYRYVISEYLVQFEQYCSWITNFNHCVTVHPIYPEYRLTFIRAVLIHYCSYTSSLVGESDRQTVLACPRTTSYKTSLTIPTKINIKQTLICFCTFVCAAKQQST